MTFGSGGAPAAGLGTSRWSSPEILVGLSGALLAAAVILGGPTIIGFMMLPLLIAMILIYPVVGVASLLITAPLYLLLSPYIPRGLPFSFLLLVLTLVGVALRRVYQKRDRPLRWSAPDVMAGFLLANGLLYIPPASTLAAGVYGYHEVFRVFLLYFVARLLAPGRRAQVALLWAVGLVAFGVLLYGVIQHFWNYDYIMVKYGLTESLRDYAGFSGKNLQRAYSVTISPITLGFIGMIGALSAIAILSFTGRRDRALFAAPLLLAAAVASTALTYTRSAWLGTAFGAGIGIVVLGRGRIRLPWVLGSIGAGALAMRYLPDLAGKIGDYALTIVSQDPTDTSFHYVALVEAAQFFWSHLAGVGLGAATFSGFHHGGAEGVQIWSENAFFMVGIQTGAQSLVALVLFLIFAAWAGLKLLRDRQADLFQRRLGAVVLFGFPAFAVAAMALPAILDVSSFGPLWVFGALAVNAREELAARPRDADATGPGL